MALVSCYPNSLTYRTITIANYVLNVEIKSYCRHLFIHIINYFCKVRRILLNHENTKLGLDLHNPCTVVNLSTTLVSCLHSVRSRAFQCIAGLLHCTALHCTALHCTVVHCSALQSSECGRCTAADLLNGEAEMENPKCLLLLPNS